MGPEDGTQVLSLSGKHRHSLSHLAAPYVSSYSFKEVSAGAHGGQKSVPDDLGGQERTSDDLVAVSNLVWVLGAEH